VRKAKARFFKCACLWQRKLSILFLRIKNMSLKRFFGVLTALVLAPHVLLAHTANDVFDFFAEEARVVTASRQPTSLQNAPATVHVVTAQDMQAVGVQTLWDALRMVPGVDVMIVQTFQGEVSIRGLNKAINNRVLVLLDNKPILSGYFERVNWEYLPVGLAEISRIEVVLGPVSALYGPNAISGVINIITKTPEEIETGVVQVMTGEYHTVLANVMAGHKVDQVSVKVSGGWRSTRLLDDPDDSASQVGQFHGLFKYDIDEQSNLALRGGLVHIDSRNNVGGLGSSFERGPSGYLRADYQKGETRVQGFWNHNSTVLEDDDDFATVHFDLDYDHLELNLEQDFTLPYDQLLTVGGSVRHNRLQSGALSLGKHKRSLWSLFFEDRWQLYRQLSVVLSGRLDHHSTAGLQSSPRGSVVWEPKLGHVLRLSAGTSFRFPTISESEMDVVDQFSLSEENNLTFDVVELLLLGNSDLKAEQMRMLEVAHTFQHKNVHWMGTAYVYRLKNVIATTFPQIELTSTVPKVHISFENRPGTVRAWGGEAGIKMFFKPNLVGAINYTYQNIKDGIDPLTATDGGPKHKVNLGLQLKAKGWCVGGWLHWVGATNWFQNSLVPNTNDVGQVDAYTLVNSQVHYSFSGKLSGWTMGVAAFNLLNQDHFETLPASALGQGQRGEWVRRRIVGTLTYAF